MNREMTKAKLTDEDIEVIVYNKISQSSTWYSASKLSKERETVLRYYNGEYPKRQHDGSSTYISTEVYDSVEMMRAQLLETFSGGKEVVKFDPQGPEDVESSAVATSYTDYVVFRQNNGYGIFSDAIFDGLTARVGVAKVYWDECYDYKDEEFEGLPEEAIMGLSSMDDVTNLDAKQDTSGNYSGKLTRKIDNSRVCIEVINPEEFSVESQAKALSKDYFCVHSTLKQYEDLVNEGYPEEELKKALAAADSTDLHITPEVRARFQQLDEGVTLDDDEVQEATKWLVVHEAYIKLKRSGDKYTKLYKVVMVGKEMLDIEEVDDLPFVAWTPIPVAHAFYGNNFANRVTSYQNIRTNLIRSIVDHTAITVNPRYTVLRGGLTNPRELLDNRLGGIVNTTRPDAVLPLQQAPLNPFVYQTLEMLKMQNEEMTGISSLSQGLNKDAVSSQNSQGLINDLVNMSQTRQKVIARNFAYQFMVPLYLKVYDIVLKNEKKANIMDVAGNWVEVNPQSWAERKTCTVSLHLGYGEMDREADKYAQMAMIWAQDPQTASMFTTENRYRMATDVAKMRGINNVNAYLTPPNRIPPPQPDPRVIAELENEKMKAEATMVSAQASMKKVDAHIAIEDMRAQLQKLQADFDNNIKDRDADRKDIDIVNKVDLGQREMDLAEQIEPMEAKQNLLISPRG